MARSCKLPPNLAACTYLLCTYLLDIRRTYRTSSAHTSTAHAEPPPQHLPSTAAGTTGGSRDRRCAGLPGQGLPGQAMRSLHGTATGARTATGTGDARLPGHTTAGTGDAQLVCRTAAGTEIACIACPECVPSACIACLCFDFRRDAVEFGFVVSDRRATGTFKSAQVRAAEPLHSAERMRYPIPLAMKLDETLDLGESR